MRRADHVWPAFTQGSVRASRVGRPHQSMIECYGLVLIEWSGLGRGSSSRLVIVCGGGAEDSTPRSGSKLGLYLDITGLLDIY